jgi:hypothetical protein
MVSHIQLHPDFESGIPIPVLVPVNLCNLVFYPHRHNPCHHVQWICGIKF